VSLIASGEFNHVSGELPCVCELNRVFDEFTCMVSLISVW
jgi:hypothetical protein